jgi:anti-sigma B factor antagonist
VSRRGGRSAWACCGETGGVRVYATVVPPRFRARAKREIPADGVRRAHQAQIEPERLMASTSHRKIDVEEIGDVTVARFVDRKILDETNIQIVGNQLFTLVDDEGRRKIVLDFNNVEYLSSAALGKLITLDKKVKANGGKLRLCSVRPEIYEVFAITRLNKLFDMYDDQEKALEGF